MTLRIHLTCFVLAACLGSASTSAWGGVTITYIEPRQGFFEIKSFPSSFPSAQSVLSTADSDEATKTATATAPPLTGATYFNILTGALAGPAFSQPTQLYVNANPYVPYSGNVITRSPGDLDAGNWAFAISVGDETGMKAFFQMRLAGSSATVLDSSLAAQAVSLGLWSSPTDYFEFTPSDRYIALIVPPGGVVNGPEDYRDFFLPEPSSGSLLLAAIGATGMWRRRALLRVQSF